MADDNAQTTPLGDPSSELFRSGDDWVICDDLYGRPVHTLQSGDLVWLEVDGVWHQTRIVSVRRWFGRAQLASVDGHPLRNYGCIGLIR